MGKYLLFIMLLYLYAAGNSRRLRRNRLPPFSYNQVQLDSTDYIRLNLRVSYLLSVKTRFSV